MNQRSKTLPRVSIITVVYNNAPLLKRTMASVFALSWPHYEYLIVDGGSTDGTRELIESEAHRLAWWCSEKDDGIYPAMNKGLAAATGDYVWFLNAGDEAHSPNILETVFAVAEAADIYYGDTEFITQNRQSMGRRSVVSTHPLPRHITWRDMRYGLVMCHQSILVRRRLATEYDVRFVCAADCDWIIAALKQAEQIAFVPAPLSRYLAEDGFSRRRHGQYLRERFRILQRHFGVFANLLNHLIILLRALRHKVA